MEKGEWLNVTSEFERKRSRQNFLTLCFYNTLGKNVKLFLKKNIIIPTTNILPLDRSLESILSEIRVDPELKDFPVRTREGVKSLVLEIEVPNSSEIIDKLPKVFETGNYDKFLRFRGFYPERFVSLDNNMERVFEEISVIQREGRTVNDKDAQGIDAQLKNADPKNCFVFNKDYGKHIAILNSLNGINYTDRYPDIDYLLNVGCVSLDIEKPLWKKEEEKTRLKAREVLFKERKKIEKIPPDKRTESDLEAVLYLNKDISKLEEELTTKIDGIGRVNLSNDLIDSRISWTIMLLQDQFRKKEKLELYVWDPRNEFNYEEFNGAIVRKAKTEKELLDNLKSSLRKWSPLIAIAMNGAYDHTQIRMAFNQYGEVYDPFFDDMQPRRDLVRQQVQRMKEDVIYWDLMRIAMTFFPFMGQRSLGTNFKLESIAKQVGLTFKKIVTHEDLRFIEISRLMHSDPEVRKKMLETAATYTVSDVFPLLKAKERDFIDLFCKIKNAAPYLTHTQIAFGPNCMQKVHEQHHFSRFGNLPDFHYSRKQREDEIQIFRKRFYSLHKAKLKKAGIFFRKGSFKDVREIYIPIEEWISPVLFRIVPELERVYKEVQNSATQKFGFLQYLRFFARDVFVDYHRAKKEAIEYWRSRNANFTNTSDYETDRIRAKSIISWWNEESFEKAFDELKNAFRSIYVPLPGQARQITRPTSERIKKLGLADYLEDEADLYLLHRNADEIITLFPEKKREEKEREMRRFQSTFNTFEQIWNKFDQRLSNAQIDGARGLIYTMMREQRAKRYSDIMKQRHLCSWTEVSNLLESNYNRLAGNIRKANAIVLDMKGSYLFVKSSSQIEGTYEVRRLPEYPLQEDLSKTVAREEDNKQLSFF